MNEAGLDGAEPPRRLEEDEPSVAEEDRSLVEYLLGEEGGEWLWLLAPLLAG